MQVARICWRLVLKLCLLLLIAYTLMILLATNPKAGSQSNHEQEGSTEVQLRTEDRRRRDVLGYNPFSGTGRTRKNHSRNSIRSLATTESQTKNSTKDKRVFLDIRSEDITDNMTLFQPVLSEIERDILMDLAEKLWSTCWRVSVPCVLYGGSLLGSWRHHGLVPWDDDVDVFIPQTRRGLISRELNMISEDYHCEYAGPRLKFFSLKGQQTSRYPWRWPYVDISFYKENDTHIWDAAIDMSHYKYPKSIMFPLHKRPLGRLSLDAPFDSFAALKLTYSSVLCTTHYYSHRHEKIVAKKLYSIKCEKLKHLHSFVHREVAARGNGLLESLVKGDGSVIHTKFVPEPTYAVTKPYILELENVP